MKKKIFTIGLVILGASLNAQVSDSVALGAGYMNESYYSLEDGEVVNVANNTWDLAFDMSNFGATIRANRLSEVYLYPGGVGDWETLDTAGITGWTRYYNGDANWSYGALNAPASPDDAVDLGWGEYNTTTHYTEGSRLFVVKLQSGDYKKLFIEELGAGAYTFQYDLLDNSDLTNDVIAKADYSDQNFIHYSLETKVIVSREPISAEWDIVFSNYHSEVAPDAYYGVTGVLSNIGTETQEINDVPLADATFGGAFDTEANIIGYDWKSFNIDTYAYDIADSLTYFVFTQAGDVWKLVMTGFNGSSDGKIYFTKEMISAAGIEEANTIQITTYPNPAVNVLNISSTETIENVKIYNINGQLVLSNSNESNSTIQLDVAQFENGIYILETTTLSGISAVRKIIITD
tara:strand:+ start:13512 stop:14726 length:1215 start_codon:yes stop_codon:yes gene_type:complete